MIATGTDLPMSPQGEEARPRAMHFTGTEVR